MLVTSSKQTRVPQAGIWSGSRLPFPFLVLDLDPNARFLSRLYRGSRNSLKRNQPPRGDPIYG